MSFPTQETRRYSRKTLYYTRGKKKKKSARILCFHDENTAVESELKRSRSCLFVRLFNRENAFIFPKVNILKGRRLRARNKWCKADEIKGFGIYFPLHIKFSKEKTKVKRCT